MKTKNSTTETGNVSWADVRKSVRALERSLDKLEFILLWPAGLKLPAERLSIFK